MRAPTPFVLAALWLAGCAQEAPPEPAPRPAVVREIKLGGTERLQVYSGEVRARHETDRSFRVGGKVVERSVNLGDQVKRGQVLARLDPEDVQLGAAAARAQMTAAEADLRLAANEFQRTQSLAERNFVSSSVVDQRREAVRAAEARLRQARSQAEVAANQAGYASLVADRAGVVTAVLADVGQVVGAGTPVVRVADSSEREVLIYVPEKRIDGIKPGDQAFIRPWAEQDATLPGTVREVAAAADVATRTYPVRVTVTQGGDRLNLGATAAVGFVAEQGSTVALPLAALVRREGQSQVWVLNRDNVVEARTVKVLRFTDSGAVIGEGLKNGERVIVVGAHTLLAGARVRPLAENAPATVDAQR